MFDPIRPSRKRDKTDRFLTVLLGIVFAVFVMYAAIPFILYLLGPLF